MVMTRAENYTSFLNLKQANNVARPNASADESESFFFFYETTQEEKAGPRHLLGSHWPTNTNKHLPISRLTPIFRLLIIP